MLIVTIILALYACITPFLMLKAVQFGASFTEKPSKAPIFNIPKRGKTVEPTLEEKKRAQMWANMNNYDGTSNHQVPLSEVE